MSNTPTCETEGCQEEGNPCWLPGNYDADHPDFWHCGKHMHQEGFCWGCGTFWGGVESFDFGAGARTGLCENCLSSGEFDEDEDEEMDAVYSSYPFDGEGDWR